MILSKIIFSPAKNAVILTKITFSPAKAKSHMHIFNMLEISMHSFILNALKLSEDYIIQSCYPLLKHNLKIVLVKNAITLSKIIFSPAKNAVILTKIIFSPAKAKSHMHIFNMLEISMHNFILNALKLSKDLIIQSCYPLLKPNLKIV